MLQDRRDREHPLTTKAQSRNVVQNSGRNEFFEFFVDYSDSYLTNRSRQRRLKLQAASRDKSLVNIYGSIGLDPFEP